METLDMPSDSKLGNDLWMYLAVSIYDYFKKVILFSVTVLFKSYQLISEPGVSS